MIDQEGVKIVDRIVDETARVKLIEVGGFVDQANCHLLQNIIDKCLEEQFYNLVFDLQSLVYMSSAGWGVLIGEIRRFRESAGDIKLANMGPEIYEVYQMLEFYHIISEYGSLEEALKSFDMITSIDKFDIRKAQKKEEEEPALEVPPPQPEPAPYIPPVEESPVKQEPEPQVQEVIEVPEPEIEEIPEPELPPEPEIEETPIVETEPLMDETVVMDSISNNEINEVEIDASPEEEAVVEAPLENEDIQEFDTPAPAEEDMSEETPPENYPEETVKEVYVENEDSNHVEEEVVPDPVPDKKEPDNASQKEEVEAYAEDEPVENPGIILEEEIDVNIDGILASEGISKSISQVDPSGYITFDPSKYNRNINIKVMPIPDKIRDIVSKYPELSPRQIQKMLTHPDYGGVKIGFFKLRSLLKALDLETKEKRYRFYRSA